jgi:hypothetical protein
VHSTEVVVCVVQRGIKWITVMIAAALFAIGRPHGINPQDVPGYKASARRIVPGLRDVWRAVVGIRPILDWVRAKEADSLEMKFDVLDSRRAAAPGAASAVARAKPVMPQLLRRNSCAAGDS